MNTAQQDKAVRALVDAAVEMFLAGVERFGSADAFFAAEQAYRQVTKPKG